MKSTLECLIEGKGGWNKGGVMRVLENSSKLKKRGDWKILENLIAEVYILFDTLKQNTKKLKCFELLSPTY